MSKFPRMMVALGAALLALLIAGAALAQQPPGQTFFGTASGVTIDGNTAPAGTVIVAMANGEEVGRDTLDAAGWQIDVPGDTGEVMFSVNDIMVDVSYPVSQAGTNLITLNAVTPQEEPEEEPATEPDGNGDELQGDDDSLDGGDTGSMMDDGSGDDSLDGAMTTDDDDTGAMMGEDDGDTGAMMGEGDDDSLDGDTGSMEGEDDGDTGSMMGEGSGDDSLDDDSGSMDDGSGDEPSEGTGLTMEFIDEDPPTDDAMGMGDDAMGTGDDAMGMGDDAMGTGDDAMGTGDDSMEQAPEETTDVAPEGTVGGVNDFSTTGTGGLADRGSSAALWGSIGGALALTALLLGGFAVRRRRAQS